MTQYGTLQNQSKIKSLGVILGTMQYYGHCGYIDSAVY